MSNITTSQTIGPFPHEAWGWAVAITADVNSSAPQVQLRGTIFDGDGVPVTDAWAEAWLPASAASETAHAIPGYRRVPTDENGTFALSISQAHAPAGRPVAYITVFARGLVKHQFTAAFLADDPALALSPLLQQVPAARRATLLAHRQDDGSYVWDIHLQGERETVFFDYT